MNLLFVFTDQQTIGAMGAAGHRHVRTPHLDSLAASGVRFTNSFCASPLCSPSRGSLATGRLPAGSTVTTNHKPLPPDLPHLGGTLQAAGFETIWAGKWHVPEEYPLAGEPIPGFATLPLPGRQTDRNGYPVRIDGRPGAWDHNLGAYVDDPVAEAAAAWLRTAHANPFCLAVSLMNPHDICFPESWARAGTPPGADLPPLPANFDPPLGEPALLADTRYTHEGMAKIAKDWTDRDWRTARWIYDRFTEMADRAVGTVLEALKSSGHDRDTLVCFTSDHGEGAGSHRWLGKLSLYTEAVAVPFMLSCPGTISARVDADHLVSGVDVFPTLCDYAGVPAPAGLDGVSLRPVVEQPSLPGRDAAIVAMHPVWKDAVDEGRLLRTGSWAYASFSRGPHPESLYDLREDPGETRNLAGDPARAAVRGELRELLRAKLSLAGDAFPVTSAG